MVQGWKQKGRTLVFVVELELVAGVGVLVREESGVLLDEALSLSKTVLVFCTSPKEIVG